MSSLKKSVQFFSIQYRKALLIFWGILLIVNIDQSFVRSFFTGRGNLNDSISSTFTAVWIFILVTSIINATHLFSMMMNYSVTRKKYYQTTILWTVIISFVMALTTVVMIYGLQFIATQLEISVTTPPNVTPVYMLYHLFTTNLIVAVLSMITGALFYLYNFIAGMASLLVYYAIFYQYVYHNLVELTQIRQPMWIHNHVIFLLACVLLGLAWFIYRGVSINTKKK